ncbi:MAG: hypothetical protein Q4A92_08060 [Corynebacterium sp.]|nr:hypothetical protein [Corynebacterium sp.]
MEDDVVLPPKKDHRTALQANKLRMTLATRAVRFGVYEPVVPVKTVKILIVSAVIAGILIVVTIGAAKVIQML